MDQTVISTGLPAGHNSVNSFVVVRGAAKFIDFITAVFDGIEATGLRTPDRDGTLIHAEIRLGNATLMIADAKSDWPDFHALTQVHVADAQAVLDRARTLGATIVTEPTAFYGGVLIARFVDPWGNLWWLYQPLANEKADAVADTSWHSREPSYVYTTLMDAMRVLTSK